MLILILFAFIAGIVTVLSPCILPILPIVLSGSVGEGKRRPIGIVAGFVTSFTFFTLALSTIVQATGLPSDLLRNIAIVTIVALGLSMLLPQTQLFLEKVFSRVANFIPRSTKSTGFVGGLVLGVTLGLVWAPCVGPILASVITLAITSSVTFAAIIITLAYSLGTSIPMLAIILGGRQLLQKNQWLLVNSEKIQRGFGVVMVIVGISMFFQLDRSFQTLILEKFPQYGAGLTAVEDNSLVQQQLQTLTGRANELLTTELLPPTRQAPDFTGGGEWINSQPLSLSAELKGKVVLVDFWTYSCINCIRTFPYLREWYDRYKDKGFVIVGVHSPEFEFEKKFANVQQATQDFQLPYPIVLDNQFAIWNAYRNQAWPAHYLIDQNGYIRYVHIGEGKYNKTEQAIRDVLGEAVTDTPMTDITSQQPNPRVASVRQTPETYLGWGRAAGYTVENKISRDQVASYSYQSQLDTHEVGLDGQWRVGNENITAISSQAKLSMVFSAKEVYLIMSSVDGQPKNVKVYLDGAEVTSQNATVDMATPGSITVQAARKYDIVRLPEFGTHTLDLVVEAGTEAFAFTFGSADQ